MNIKRRKRLTKLTGSTEDEIWRWLWNNADYSLLELIEKSGIGVSEYSMQKKFTVLIGNRVVYPDGTMNSFVQRFLRERVLRLFDSKTRKPTKGKS